MRLDIVVDNGESGGQEGLGGRMECVRSRNQGAEAEAQVLVLSSIGSERGPLERL